MIKIVLPFLLIGKALKPLAKIKKKAWSAMGSAFKSIRGSIDPMKSFSKIMEVLSIIMLPLTFIFTILAQIIAKQLLPHIINLIEYIDELGDVAKTSTDEVDYLTLAWEGWMWQNEMIIMSLETLFYYLFIWRGHIDAMNSGAETLMLSLQGVIDFFTGLGIGIYAFWTGVGQDLLDWLEDLGNAIIDLFTLDLDLGGGGGGGGGDGPTIWETIEDIFTPPGAKTSTLSTSNTVNINLSNSIIENKDKLVRDIVEQVIIRIG